MLVLGRRQGQSIKIGKDIEVTITRINESQVSVGIDAPREILILRSELKPKQPLDYAADTVCSTTK
jgi:carbon storage regulator